MQNDTDSSLERAQFRGELEGVTYAIKTINCFK
jgi:hypothetical protein